MSRRDEELEEINYLLDTLSPMECRNMFCRVSYPALVKLGIAIRAAIKDAVDDEAEARG